MTKCRFVLLLILGGLAAWVPPSVYAQASAAFPTKPPREGKDHGSYDRLPDKPSIAPTLTIPADALGFSAPGPIYLGQRNSLVSLDFIDDNRLLFTFRVPGLMHRDPSDQGWSDERQIKAVVLTLPEGTVAAEALWTVHDRVRYLWMLKNGHFLLRDGQGLQEGDATLTLKPLLHFPGPLLWLEMDPSQQLLVTNSREPAATASKPGDVASPPSAKASVTSDDAKAVNSPELVVRILRRESGQVMLVSRSRGAVHLPINSEGYIESLRGTNGQWALNLNYFSGGSTPLGRVNSACSPSFDFLSQKEVLVTACDGSGGHKLIAMSTDGRRLWEDSSSPQAIWPMLITAANGSRIARETLAVNHSVNAYDPLDSADIKGQLVRVFDAADGKLAFQAPASPALDAGGNVALSASGRRVALLNGPSIQIFDLPAPAVMQDAAANHAAH
jgi:hypothetical protein